MFDAFWHARARPGARPRANRAAPSQTRAHARARAYKADRGLDRMPPLALNLAGAQVHRRLLCARRASGRPRPDHRRPAILGIPRPVRPSREPLRVLVKLLEPGIELSSPETPDQRRRTSPDRRRTWTELHGESFFDSLHG
jgi:hypothetical protein